MKKVKYITIYGEPMTRHGRIEIFTNFYLFTPIGYKLPITIDEDRIIDISDILEYEPKPDDPT